MWNTARRIHRVWPEFAWASTPISAGALCISAHGSRLAEKVLPQLSAQLADLCQEPVMADWRLDGVDLHVSRKGIRELLRLRGEVQAVRVHCRDEEFGGGLRQGLLEA